MRSNNRLKRISISTKFQATINQHQKGGLTSLFVAEAEIEAETVDENDDDDDDEVIVTVALAESMVLSRHTGGLQR